MAPRPGTMRRVPRPTHPAARRVLIALAVAASSLAAAAASAVAADAPLLYLREEPAVVVDQALGGGTLRQAPLATNARWTPAETVGKVTGRELAGAGPARIASLLRAGWRQEGVGGLVAVDEVTPAQWTPTSAAALATALDILGPDARRVIFYAAPSFVERVGRVDPRAELPATLAGLIDAVSRGRATYLLTYRGDMSPFPAREMATHPTRWAARWPAGRGELRLMLGADGGAGQAELWARVRATPAGRDMLSRGPGAYGLRDAGARPLVARPVPRLPLCADGVRDGRRLPGARRGRPDADGRGQGPGEGRPGAGRQRRRDHDPGPRRHGAGHPQADRAGRGGRRAHPHRQPAGPLPDPGRADRGRPARSRRRHGARQEVVRAPGTERPA